MSDDKTPKALWRRWTEDAESELALLRDIRTVFDHRFKIIADRRMTDAIVDAAMRWHRAIQWGSSASRRSGISQAGRDASSETYLASMALHAACEAAEEDDDGGSV